MLGRQTADEYQHTREVDEPMADGHPAPIKIEATERSPEINFDFERNVFSIRGESYPEDVMAFYGPVMTAFSGHLSSLTSGAIEFNFELIYFNSSSAKILLDLFDKLEESASAGVSVVVNWYHDAEDDTMEELGQEFAEDLEHATFNLKQLGS